MSILNLKQVRDQRIRRQAAAKILSRLFRIFLAIKILVECFEGRYLGVLLLKHLLDMMNCHCILDELD